MYSDADLYLLDDPLSAVDSHVGKVRAAAACSTSPSRCCCLLRCALALLLPAPPRPRAAADASAPVQHIFKHCIAGVLSGKLRILVTNAMQYVRYADRVVVMDSGRIVEQGTYAEVMSQNGACAMGRTSRA